MAPASAPCSSGVGRRWSLPHELRTQTEVFDRYGGKLQLLARKNHVVSRLFLVRRVGRHHRWPIFGGTRRRTQWEQSGRLLPATVRLSRQRDESSCQLFSTKSLVRARLAECSHRHAVSTLSLLL